MLTRPAPVAVVVLQAFYRLALDNDRTGMPILTGARQIPGVETKVETLQ